MNKLATVYYDKKALDRLREKMVFVRWKEPMFVNRVVKVAHASDCRCPECLGIVEYILSLDRSDYGH